MKNFIVILLFLILPLSVSAKMYKCTDANGNVSFTDKPCQNQKQEILEKSSTPKPSESKPETENNDFQESKRFKPMPDGTKVTSSSPLGKVYMKFISALNRCDFNEMIKYSSGETIKHMSPSGDAQSKDICKELQKILAQDLKGATEVIDGDKGKIQWLFVSSGANTKVRSVQNENFIRENGAWKIE